jgi:3-hydroxy-9,10-secoandrosta-1,3,5(10)-triene-9,17-dione monooxygenase
MIPAPVEMPAFGPTLAAEHKFTYVLGMSSTMDHLEFVRRCESLSGGLRARAEEAEAIRRLPEATMQDVRAADLLRGVVPTSLGGHGLGLESLAQGARVMAHGCPASAWTISFLIMHGWLLAKFPAAGRAELFAADPAPLAPAPLAPTGTVTVEDGGYRLNGRWEWATGVMHADWVIVHALQAEPEFAMLFLVVPRSDVEVDDVWFTSGMRATGSNTVRIEDQFVPDHRALSAQSLLYGGEWLEGDGLARHPVPSVLALVAAAPALGAAEAAVELFEERLAERVLAYSLGDRQREQPAAQVRLATAISDLRSARVRWDAALADIAAASVDGEPGEELRVATRLSAAATVRASRQVISTVCEGAGASIYMSSSPLQRLQRDVEVLKGHVIFDWDRTAELAGRFALGFGLRPTDMV